VAEVNDAAYGILPDWSLAPALETLEDPATRAHVVEAGGRPAACAVSHRRDGDCYLYFVATIPEARGRGLATELLSSLLREARDAGCSTTSLESSAIAEPLYAALGYRSLGPIEMWEHRVW
jgi:GNAT superfamily N-acetyltransferase